VSAALCPEQDARVVTGSDRLGVYDEVGFVFGASPHLHAMGRVSPRTRGQENYTFE